MRGTVVGIRIDAHHDADVGSLAGSRNNDLFCAAIKMPGKGVAILERTGRFHGDVNAELPPLPFAGLAARHDNVPAIDDNAVIVIAHGPLKGAVHGVVFEHMRQLGIIRTGVDGANDNILGIGQQAEQITTDTAEAVHPQFYGHTRVLLENERLRSEGQAENILPEKRNSWSVCNDTVAGGTPGKGQTSRHTLTEQKT